MHRLRAGKTAIGYAKDNDIVLDALGIQNVGVGHYTRTDGTVLQGSGVCDWLALVDGPVRQRARQARSKDRADEGISAAAQLGTARSG